MLPSNLLINFLFQISLSFSSFAEQRLSALLNAMTDRLKNFRPSFLSNYQGLLKSPKYCEHDLLITIIYYNIKISEVCCKVPSHGSSQRERWHCCSTSWQRAKRRAGWGWSGGRLHLIETRGSNKWFVLDWAPAHRADPLAAGNFIMD